MGALRRNATLKWIRSRDQRERSDLGTFLGRCRRCDGNDDRSLCTYDIGDAKEYLRKPRTNNFSMGLIER